MAAVADGSSGGIDPGVLRIVLGGLSALVVAVAALVVFAIVHSRRAARRAATDVAPEDHRPGCSQGAPTSRGKHEHDTNRTLVRDHAGGRGRRGRHRRPARGQRVRGHRGHERLRRQPGRQRSGLGRDRRPGALHGVSDGTVTVTGSGFDGDAQGRGFGVYVVYGPKQADYATNSGWFGSAQWVSKSAFTAGGGFTTTIDVAKSYTADPHHTGDAAATVSCDYDATKTATANAALGQYECFVQTFSAHGVANDPVDLDEVQVPVTW